MNYSILKKVSDELLKDKPDISYLRGMVETLLSLENSGGSGPYVTPNVIVQGAGGVWTQPTKIPETVNLGRTPSLNGIQDFVAKSVKIE